MFKLIKIQNSGINVPELEKLKKLSSTTIKRGEALIVEDGFVKSAPETAKPNYIAFSEAAYNSGDVVCYPVSSDMLFETSVNADPTALLMGAKVTIGKDTDGCSVCVTATTASGVATIVDLMGASESGDKVTVKF